MQKSSSTGHFKLLLLIAIGTALLTLSPWGKQVDNAIYDSIMINRGEPIRTEDIVVVGIDEPSFQQIGIQWPWPRELHAKLVSELSKQNAKVIAFDLLFPEETDSANDKAFGDAISAASNVIVGTDFKIIKHPSYTIKTPVKPIGTLIDAGARTGHVSIPVDADGFVRRVEPVLENTPSLGYAAASLFQENVCCDLQALPEEVLINFAGRQNSFQQVSYYQALEPEKYLPDNFFENKIVFVGVRSLSATLPDRQSADHYATPLTRWDEGYTSGVMIHAFATANLLTQQWNIIGSRVLAAFTGLIIAVLFARYGIREDLKLTVINGLVVITVLTAATLTHFAKTQLYFPILSSGAPLLMVLLISPYYNYLIEQKRKREIRKAFSTYVNEAIVKQIEDNPENLKLGGKQIDGTVLFMDIAGFSTLTEKESPEAMINFINEFLSAIIEIGMAEGGTVERFLGDAVMLIWGAPVEQQDHALLACKAACKMEKKIQEIADSAMERYGFQVSARIGINSGSMTAGNIGGSDRFCYTVLGDCVNLAARFESANKVYGTTTLIGQETVDLVGDAFNYALIDTARVKGREQPENMYQLLVDSDSRNQQDRSGYQQGLALLLEGQPAKAKSKFAALEGSLPEKAVNLMLERCEQLIASNEQDTGSSPVFDISKA